MAGAAFLVPGLFFISYSPAVLLKVPFNKTAAVFKNSRRKPDLWSGLLHGFSK